MFPPVRTFFTPYYTEKCRAVETATSNNGWKKSTICSLTGRQNLLIGVTKVNRTYTEKILLRKVLKNQAKGEADVKHPYMENL
jgi:hypothetical protein